MISERFWKEATKNRNLMTGMDHQYFVDNGFKVERYSDGTIEIYDTKQGGYFYKKINDPIILINFLQYGFDKTSLELTISHMEERRNRTTSASDKSVYDEMIKRYKIKLQYCD